MMAHFSHDGLTFHYRDMGTGTPFVFQHGLGGDVNQPYDLFRPPAGFRLLAFDCRAHGETQPLGPPEKIHIASFADDLGKFLDHLEIKAAVVGGISMGAAVAMNFALRFPDRVLGLVQSRPAWLAGPNRENHRVFSYISRLLQQHGCQRGQPIFRESEIYRTILDRAPETATSLAGQFDNPHAVERAIRLELIPLDAPYQQLDELKAVDVPTLVLANRQDPVHPFEFGAELAGAVPNAEFHEITSKSVSAEQHGQDVQRYLADFLVRYFSPKSSCNHS